MAQADFFFLVFLLLLLLPEVHKRKEICCETLRHRQHEGSQEQATVVAFLLSNDWLLPDFLRGRQNGYPAATSQRIKKKKVGLLFLTFPNPPLQ